MDKEAKMTCYLMEQVDTQPVAALAHLSNIEMISRNICWFQQVVFGLVAAGVLGYLAGLTIYQQSVQLSLLPPFMGLLGFLWHLLWWKNMRIKYSKAPLAPWIHGTTACHGALSHDAMAPWPHGPMAPWPHSPMAPWKLTVVLLLSSLVPSSLPSLQQQDTNKLLTNTG